jgi:hypothetical protein
VRDWMIWNTPERFVKHPFANGKVFTRRPTDEVCCFWLAVIDTCSM